MSVFLRRLAPAVFGLFALFATVSGASAHAKLEDSDPLENGTIATPYVLVARYDEELAADRSSVVVRNNAGDIVAEGGVATDDAFTMVAELPLLPPGAYVAHWIAITPDDNGKTQGDITFNVIAATPSPSPTPTRSPTAPPSTGPPASTAPTATASSAPSPTVSPAPSPAPDGGQPSGTELIVPLVLAGAVVVALGWFLLRRRPS
jgi:methionine-rich copper-binding protein CopC